MDIIQQVNAIMLEKKLEQVRRNYNGSVLLSTYFSKVVYNQCLEIIRGRKKQIALHSEELLSKEKDDQLSVENKLIIEDEKARLDVIIKGILGLSPRLIIALKLFSRVLVKEEDYLGTLLPENEVKQNFEELFFSDYTAMNDKEVYRLASRGKVGGAFGRLDGCGADNDLIALTKQCLTPELEQRPRNQLSHPRYLFSSAITF